MIYLYVFFGCLALLLLGFLYYRWWIAVHLPLDITVNDYTERNVRTRKENEK